MECGIELRKSIAKRLFFKTEQRHQSNFLQNSENAKYHQNMSVCEFMPNTFIYSLTNENIWQSQ